VHAVLGVARGGDIKHMLFETLSVILVQRNLELERLLVRCEALQLPSYMVVSMSS
jgi:hypothetical protein